jgi:hypothetical protein
MDSTQYKNFVETVAMWRKAEAREVELLENIIPTREKLARAILDRRDASPSDRRRAQEILSQCARQTAKLQASLDGARPLIQTYEKGITEYERQRERRDGD